MRDVIPDSQLDEAIERWRKIGDSPLESGEPQALADKRHAQMMWALLSVMKEIRHASAEHRRNVQ